MLAKIGFSKGGVVICIKNTLKSSDVIFNSNDLETIAVEICNPLPCIIVVIYRPSSYNNNIFLSRLERYLHEIEAYRNNKQVIICGDFNENNLKEAGPICRKFTEYGYTQIIRQPTTMKGTLLDHMYVRNPETVEHWGVLQTTYSYHEPTFCLLNFSS